MAEILARDRLYPALLDRLSDDAPENGSEARDGRAFSWQRLRENVLRDLAWLFNTTRLGGDELGGYSEIERSVLNYGLPALSGRPATKADLPAIERALRQAIIDFEPRLIPNSVFVHSVDGGNNSYNTISFRIEAKMWARPVPLELYLRTDLDLETGQSLVREAG
jgi:type VI secretion system protein ImpF